MDEGGFGCRKAVGGSRDKGSAGGYFDSAARGVQRVTAKLACESGTRAGLRKFRDSFATTWMGADALLTVRLRDDGGSGFIDASCL
jgi:hypothetical protein